MEKFDLGASVVSLVERLKNHYKNKFRLSLDLYVGDKEKCLESVVSSVAPFGKGLLIATEKGFKKLGSTLKILASNGIKTINFISDSNIENSIEKFGELFSVPEDVRFVLYCENCFSPAASYFSHFRKIPLIFIPDSLDFKGAFDSVVSVKNGEKTDEVRIRPDRRAVIDYKFIGQNDLASAYADLAALFPTLTDYRINCSLTNVKTDAFAYDLLKECLVKGVAAVSGNEAERAEKLIYYGIQKAIVFGNCLDEFSGVSAVYAAEEILKDGGNYFDGARTCALIDIIGLYSVCFETGVVLSVPNYNQRAERLSSITGYPERKYLTNFLYQKSILSGKGERTEKIKNNLKCEYPAESGIAKKFYNTYLLLGGEKADETSANKVFQAVLYSGDVKRKINGMTLVRESGITEKLLNGKNITKR